MGRIIIFIFPLLILISCAKPEVKYIYETKYIIPDIIKLEQIKRPDLLSVFIMRDNNSNQWCMDEDNMVNFILNKRRYEQTIDKCINILNIYQDFYDEYYKKKLEIQTDSNSDE
jgi:hypothetical protein